MNPNSSIESQPTFINNINTKQMNSMLRHRLRNLCAGMKMAIGTIAEQTNDSHPHLQESCCLMTTELDDLLHFSNRLDLLFADLPPAEPYPFQHILKEAQSKFSRNFPFVTIELEGPDKDQVIQLGSWEQIILNELLNNAGEEAGTNGEVKIAWEFEPEYRLVIINTSENGWSDRIALPPQEPFTTTRNRHDGIGLAIVQRFCQAMNRSLTILTDIPNAIVIKITNKPEK